jgi:hypothetical protein
MNTQRLLVRATGLAAITLSGAWMTIASAQTAQPPARTVALVAAVGDQFARVRQRQSVGSNLEPYIRNVVQMPDQALNMAVLRGLDKAIAAERPEVARVLLALSVAPDIEKVLPADREAHTKNKLVKALTDMPERANWDEIIAVTPKWLFSERQGMGGKLSGIGLYVQPLKGNIRYDIGGLLGAEQDVETLDREDTRSTVYVAPYFYVNVTTFDAKTMRVIKTEARHDYRKIFDRKATALDVEQSFTPEQMAETIVDFVETSTLRAVSRIERRGKVEVQPPREVPVTR